MTGSSLSNPPARRILLPVTARLTIYAFLAIIVFFIAGLQTLDLYPPVHVDEPWNADRAWNRLKTGDNYSTMDVGPFPSGKGIGTAPIASGVLMWSFRFFGLGLFQTRLPALVFGAFLLLGTYFAGKQLYNPHTGLLALLLLGLSWPFLEGSHWGRPDIVVAAFVMAAFTFAVWGMRSEKPLPNLVAGILIALSVAVHPNGALFVAVLGIVYLARYGRRFFRRWEFWAFVVGCLLGSIYPGGLMAFARNVLAFALPPAPGGTAAISDLGTTHAPPLAELNPLVLIASLMGEISRYRFYDQGLDMALIGASLIFLVVRRSRSDRLLLVFLTSALLLFALLIYNKEDYYAILFYPFLLLAMAEAFVSLLRSVEGARAQRVFVASILVLFLLSSLIHFAAPVLGSFNYDYYAVTDRIRTVIPPGARVLGRPTYWLGLSDYDYRSSFSLGYYDLDSDFDLTQVLEEVHPDVLIVDDRWQYHLVDEDDPPRGPGLYRFFRYPRQEFEDFVAQRGEKLLEFTDPWHGLLEVYAIHWK
jgi:4-amino-4-deoxy-L-arabinose transferase-like glycosyltransferase